MDLRFNTRVLNKQFLLNPTLSRIAQRSSITARSPYDGIKIYSDDVVSNDFYKLVQPALYMDYSFNVNRNRYYRYLLKHHLFVIQWGRVYAHLPNTIIKINPHVSNLTPVELLDLVTIILGDYRNAKVGEWDEQIDITEYNSNEVAKRLWVLGLQSNPYNPPQSTSTYYYGSRSGNQTKVYNKAQQIGLKQQLTRIEKTHIIQNKDRKTLGAFLLDERIDVFKNLKLIDIDQIDGRKKIKKLINTEPTLMHAYRQLKSSEKKQFTRSLKYIDQCLDIQSILKRNIEKWLLSSRLLRLKVMVDEMSDVWKHSQRVLVIPQSINPIITKKICDLVGWSTHRRDTLNKTVVSTPFGFNE